MEPNTIILSGVSRADATGKLVAKGLGMIRLILQRSLMVLTAAAIFVVSTGDFAEAASRKKRAAPQPDRFAEIVIEASTGYVLSSQNPDKRLYPASLTKMMTLYLTFEALEKGTMTKNQRLYVSRRAAAQEPSSLGLRPGDTIRVEDAILAIATKSANDCAVVLAEAVGGSEDAFARQMTAQARRLGMNNTNFVNASGLHRPAQYSTARDMAILSRALIDHYPRYYRYFSTDYFTYKGNTYRNHNRLMSTYRGMDGLKTGYVYASGYNLASSAVRNGTRLIGVVFGGRTTTSRNNAMAKLLDKGFANANNIRTAGTYPVIKPAAAVAAAETRTTSVQPVMERVQLPTRKPFFIPAGDAASTAADTTLAQVETSSGAIIEQGDTQVSGDVQPDKNFLNDFQPRPMNVNVLDAQGKKGNWAIQVGAFSSHDAGTKALQFAKASLRGIVKGSDSIAPLMTERGMIYRARLAGLGRSEAAEACRILRGNCLVLSAD